ncbi:MAG: DUF1501 domain-containing protein [Pirellulaceae bacterium]|nr:DUF1501 domain-containing protein [Pirellulaceae bacterium]MDG2105019.1 DUF1501 domain-containing protein [Pirellulaceae bacterium]
MTIERNLFIPSRRQLLKTMSSGFGYLAFSGLAAKAAATERRQQEDSGQISKNPLAPKPPHFPAKAKRVIFLCMRGGPSHMDTFDYKPQLMADSGKRGKYRGSLLGSPWKFKQCGEGGLQISELFPHLASQADELCLLRGMHTDQPIHPRAMTQLHTGNPQFVRPSLGAWTLYGLGTGNDSLPGFISLNTPNGAGQNIGSAFLPAIYQGTTIGRSGRGGNRFGGSRNSQVVPDIKNANLSKRQQRKQLDFIQELNREKLERDQHQPGVEGIIESYELAFRMQDSMPELMDLGDETKDTLDLYGIGNDATNNFGRQCLLARRFAEAGVRFIEVSNGGWDHHSNLQTALPNSCQQIDKPIAGLLADLKRRGMLEETLVVWSGEFGRTPDNQSGNGRDHNNKGFTSWMAGGGVKGGFSYGATDEYGYEAVEGKCHIHDWHATILHLLGLDHERLTYRYAGRDFRLTDVHGNILREIIA